VRLSTENTAIVLDSTADCPDAQARYANWRTVPLYVRFGEETFRDSVDISAEEFYRRLRDAPEPPRSSQPTPADFAATYEELAGYERIICVLIPARLSGTLQSATLGAESAGLVERFDRTRGLLFTVETLDYLVRGGRIGKAAGLAGQLLSVKPILHIDDGEVAPLKRVRGRAKAVAELLGLFEEGTEDSPTLHVGVGHADAPADAEALVERIRLVRPRASLDIVTSLGPVIGTHGGPGTLGLFWFQDET
jgi:fatty acid-binding protein DegV